MSRFNKLRRWLHNGTAVGACALALTCTPAVLAAPAAAAFTGGGAVLPTGNPGPNDGLEVGILLSAYQFSFDGGANEFGWLLDAVFTVEGLAVNNPGPSTGGGRFYNGLGEEIRFSFDGVLTGTSIGLSGPEFTYELTYDVTGGSGRFAGIDGGGFEVVTITAANFAFIGAGDFSFIDATVPAPTTATLLALALPVVCVGARLRRRPTSDAANDRRMEALPADAAAPKPKAPRRPLSPRPAGA